jgi:hypothetical protein
MNFRVECGTRLERFCPNSSTAKSPEHKFCGAWGYNLISPAKTPTPKDLYFDEALANIHKYFPGVRTEKIVSQRDRIEGEGRDITNMFEDMKGFTPLTEMLRPEEIFSPIDQVFKNLIHKTDDYENTGNELRGDGILALSGAPFDLEVAPKRAIGSDLATQG